MTITEIFDKFVNAFKQLCKRIEGMTKPFCDIIKGTREDSSSKMQGMSPKQYGISLVKERRERSNEYNFYKTEQKVQKHYPYQRRNYNRS